MSAPLITTAAIAISTSLSGAIDLQSYRLARIAMPASWDAANLTFQSSPDGVLPYQNVYDASGNEYTVTAAAAHDIHIPVTDWLTDRFIKIRSGTSGSPVTQTASRALTVVGAP